MKLSSVFFTNVIRAVVAIAVAAALITSVVGTAFADSVLPIDGFGTGNTANDVENWRESEHPNDGDDEVIAKQSSTNSSNSDFKSPNDGRFVKIKGDDDEWLCRKIDATGFENLKLSYYWRGSGEAELSDLGIVEYRPNQTSDSACNSDANGGWVTLASHALDDSSNSSSNTQEPWATVSNFALPEALDNSSGFLIRFRNASSQDEEYFRVDGVSIDGNLLDTSKPTVTIEQKDTQDDPTYVSPIKFTVIFSEPVSDFDDAADISFVGSTAGGTLTPNISGSGTTYTVSVSGMTTQGNVVASVPAGVATDGTNSNDASTSVDHTVLFKVNQTPVADGQNVSTPYETPVDITLSGTDPDGDPITYEEFGSSVVLKTAPNIFTYTPPDNTSGHDDFEFRVCDTHGACSDNATVNIDIGSPDAPPPTPDQCVIVSDETTLIEGEESIPTFVHQQGWTHALEDVATWIWNAPLADQSSLPETVVFTKTFSLVDAPSSAKLYIASDNQYEVLVNTLPVSCDGSQENNFGTVEDCAITLQQGTNTVVFTVTNAPPAGTSEGNPAGLIYKIVAEDAACGEPDILENSCIFPESEGMQDDVELGTSGETSLQEILDDAGYSLDVFADQTNYQEWTDAGQKVYFTATFLDKFAGHSHAFGYFVNGGSFVPVFRNGAVDPAYMSALLKAPGDSTTFSVSNVNNIVFAIADWDGSTNTFYSTDQSANNDGQVHALVYNPNDNEYVLAFEDLAIPEPADRDYNDFVVKLKVDRCEKGATCEPGVELLKNGDFEDGNVGSSWNIFASGTKDWIVAWLNPSGAPEIANLELQGQGLSGWNDSTPSDTSDNQWTELDSDWYGPNNAGAGPGSVAISQTIDTVPGETYTVAFDFSPRPNTSASQNAVEVLANGTIIGSASASDPISPTLTNWSHHSFSFEADSYTTIVSFRDAGAPNDSLGTFLDNASLMCQEPKDQCNPEASNVLLSSDNDGEELLTLDQSGPASLVASPHLNWFNPAPADGEWIWKDVSTSVEDAAGGTTELFTRTFEVLGTPFDSTLTLAVDNSYEVRVNGNLVCADAGEFNYGATVNCPVPASVLQNGTNTITFEVTNMDHATANEPSNNPAGLYYKLVVNENECVIPEEPTATVTMCKVGQRDEQNNYLSGWSLYLKGASVQEDLSIPVGDSNGVASNALVEDTSYLALASGLWRNSGQGQNWVDAEYSTMDAWVTPVDGFTGYSPDILELQINSAFSPNGNWGPYSSAHEYAQSFVQLANGPANFRIYDGDPTPTVIPGWYGDNVESTLSVDLYKGYAGVTGENGCVTFTDVPYGSYTAGELMQSGWTHYATYDDNAEAVVDGGSVSVNESSEHFTIVNRPIDNGDDSEEGDTGSGMLVIKKITSYAGEGNFDFDIGGNESFYDADVVVNNNEGQTSLELPSGTYSVTETAQEDWEFASVSCEYEGESAGTPIVNGEQITIHDGETVTCTFHNNYDEDGGGNGGHRNGGPNDDNGEVLGAVAGEQESCGPLLSTYMRMGIDNSADEVTKLQGFLNTEMGSGLPETGVFGPATDSAVRAFQIKYWEDVLKPWFGFADSAIKDQDDATGYVYKTTRWKINDLFCPGSEALPALP